MSLSSRLMATAICLSAVSAVRCYHGSFQFPQPVYGPPLTYSNSFGHGSTGRSIFDDIFGGPPFFGGRDPFSGSPGNRIPQRPVCLNNQYRNLDASCNNLENPMWGTPTGVYARLQPARYGDGISSFPLSTSGRELPNARMLSLLLFPETGAVHHKFSLLAMQWGQIITHDMSLLSGPTQSRRNPTPFSPEVHKNRDMVQCCTADGKLIASPDRQCAPIRVPRDDPVHRLAGTECLQFLRAVTNRDNRQVPANVPADQLTVVTAFMDLSLVYGNDDRLARQLREGRGGRLNVRLNANGRPYPPQNLNATLVCDGALTPNEPCYFTGDTRANQNTQLSLLQVILLREHNRVATILGQVNPHWNDEVLYQEARRIVIAEYQHINYYEFLPLMLGFENMVKNDIIFPGANNYVNDYDPEVDPTVLNEHANAAFRFFHTLIRGQLQLMSEQRRILGQLRLSDWFNRPSIIEQGNNFDSLCRGIVTEESDRADQFYTSEVTQYLFKGNRTVGNDLPALDVQRGRDCGLPSYNQQRAACGLPTANSFKDLSDLISPENIAVLQRVYETVDDIDLMVGGVLERLVAGSSAGPTFLCILTEQFYRTRKGDRYFYENGNDKLIAFTPHQLREIRKSSISRFLCDDGDNISLMQRKGFLQPGPGNLVVSCSQIPAPDLTMWKDAVTRG